MTTKVPSEVLEISFTFKNSNQRQYKRSGGIVVNLVYIVPAMNKET